MDYTEGTTMMETANEMMTMADAGWVQLEVQTAWFEKHPISAETDDATDGFIAQELEREGINTSDYESEFEREVFECAVRNGMDAWLGSGLWD